VVDKASGSSLHRARLTVDESDRPIDLSIFIPVEASPDIHTARAIWIRRLDVSFARARLAIMDPV
jgi:hypothetical protein